MFNRKLKAEIADLKERLEVCEKIGADYRNKLMDMYAEKQSAGRFHSAYTFSDHDFQRYGNDRQGMQKNAIRVMSEALGRRIVRNLKAEEVIEDGVLVGYRIAVEARKVTDNPKLEPVRKNDYEGIWEEAQK